MAFIVFAIKVNAQVSIIQNAIDKLDSHQSFSYKYKEKLLDASPDTIITLYKHQLQKSAADTNYGYLFSLNTYNIKNNNRFTELYNGQKLIDIFPTDSSYDVESIFRKSPFMQTLPERLKYWKIAVTKKPSMLKSDTMINGMACAHLFINYRDTMVDHQRYFTHFDLYFSKSTGMPLVSTIKGRLSYTSNRITDYYDELHFSDYCFDQPVDIARMNVPRGFHPRKEQIVLPFLTPGTPAPDWTLTTTTGKKLTLSQLKGKVVLMDFFFIGCAPCLQSLKPLDKIYKKYKHRGLVLVSISDRDGNKTLVPYQQMQQIKNDVCGNGLEVSKAYHQSGAPLFYFIDKNGKVNKVVDGYGDDFEANATAIIDKLLKD